MNRYAKGSLAAGAGLVLLLGGAGTLAYWNDSVDLTGGTINAGTLELEADQVELQESIDGQPQRWVPGDEHTFSTTLTLDAEGDNIAGTVGLDLSSIDLGTQGANEFTYEMAVDGEPLTNGTFDGSSVVLYTFDGPVGEVEIPVDITVQLPATATESKGVSVGAENLTFTATQTPTSAAGNA